MPDWQKMLVRPDTPLVDAIRIIDSGGGQIAIVTDDERRLLGVVTDADLRKALLRGNDFKEPCSIVMTSTPISLGVGSTKAERRDVMRRRHVRQLPIIDPDGRLVDLALLMDMVAPEQILNPVVIMAGGLGSRLAELTRDTPKPLLQVGGRPLLETIIRQLNEQGFQRFFLSVNYRAHMIIDHFGDGSQLGVEIAYLQERERLGTAGALRLLPKGVDTDIVVMNGDILTKVDFRHMLAVHGLKGGALTMAVKDFALQVPYGVVQIDDDGMVESFIEKPSHRFFVNAGIYVLSPEALAHVPPDGFFDMPSLVDRLHQAGRKSRAFPVREYWMDIGVPRDYERANSDFDDHFVS